MKAEVAVFAGALVLIAATSCGAPARLQGPQVGRHVERTSTTTHGPSRIVTAEELEDVGLRDTGDALRRRIPL